MLIVAGALSGCGLFGGLGGTGTGANTPATNATPSEETNAATTTPASPVPEAAATPSTPIPVSVEIHSDCSKTTRLFIGQKPKYGSGKTTTIGSNTTMSEGRNADGTQMIWIVDDSDNGLSSAVVTVSTKRVLIDGSCTKIHAE